MLQDCYLPDDKIFQLLPCIADLHELDISLNHITIQSYNAIAEKIKQTEQENQNSLRTLTLTNCTEKMKEDLEKNS